MALNKVFIIGNLGKDAEAGTTNGGVPVVKLSIATTERFKDRNGDYKEVTEWHTARVWRQQAEYISKYGKKGAQVYVEGRLHRDTWEGRDGQKHEQMIVEVDDIQLLGRPDDGRASVSGRDMVSAINGTKRIKSRPIQAYDSNDGTDDMPF